MCKKALKDAGEKMDKTPGQIKVASCHPDGTATVKVFSQEELILRSLGIIK